MRGKLFPGSASITQMLYFQSFCCRSLHKWPRFYFSKIKHVQFVNNSCFKFQLCTSKQFDILARSSKSVATSVEEDVYVQLKKLMKSGLLRRKNIDKALVNNASYEDLGKSLLVLECISKVPDISPKNRVKLAEEFLSKVKSVGGIVTEAHCLQVLECYLQSKYFGHLDSFLSEIKNYGVNHSEEIQLFVFKCLSVKGLNKKDSAFAKALENSNFQNNKGLQATKIYNTALSRGINEALKEIKQMKENNIKIGSEIYTSILKAIALKGDGVHIQDLTKNLSLEGITLSDCQILDILENVALSKNYNLMSHVKFLCVVEVLLKTSQILLVKLIHSDNIKSAYVFMNHLFTLNLNLESGDKEIYFNSMCKSFIEELCNINCPMNDVIKMCQQLREIKTCSYSLEHALYCYLKKEDITSSLFVLHQMFNDHLKIEAHYFWPLFVTAKKKLGDEGIILVLNKMIALKVPFTPETLTDYVFPNMSDLKFVIHILIRVPLVEAQQELMMEVFVLYTVKNRLFKECLQFLAKYPLREEKKYNFLTDHLVEALLENPYDEDIVLVAKKTNAVDPFLVISSLWSRDDKEETKEISRLFKKHDMYTKKHEEAESLIKLNENQPILKNAVLNILNKNARDSEDRETNTHSIKTNKTSRFEELRKLENEEVLLAELKAKNLNTVGQRLKLVKSYMRNQFYDKAVEAKNEVLELLGKNAEFSPGYLMSLARLSAYENDVDNSILYFDTLRKKYPYFKVGCVTGLAMCVNFMENHRYKEMLSVLRTLPKWEGTVEDLLPRSVQLLREVARIGMPELTDIVFKIMMQKKFIDVNGNTLQVYTKTYLYANDLERAVKEYVRLVEDKGIFCSTAPILWAAVQKDRFDLVDEITNLCLSKTKNKNYLVTLLTMVASRGDVNSLISYSEKFGFALDDELMIKKFIEGKFPFCPNKAFETLILSAKAKKLPYDHFVEGTVLKILMAENYKEATDFLKFCESNDVSLSKYQSAKLRTRSQLGEMTAESAPGGGHKKKSS